MSKKHSKGQWYKSGFVTQRMLDTAIDYSRSRMSEQQLENEYRRLGITKVNSFEDFVKNFKFKPKVASKYYEQYQYRDELIARGQYDEIRAQGYMENYIRAFEVVSGKDLTKTFKRIVDNLQRLSSSQLVDLMQLNSGERGAFSNLPAIAMIYNIGGTINIDGGEIVITENYIEDKFKQAFDEAQFNYMNIVDYGYEPEPEPDYLAYVVDTYHRKRSYTESESRGIYYRDQYRKSTDDFIKTYARVIPYRDIGAYATSDFAVDRLTDYYREHVGRIKVKKDGSAYIPFVKKNVSNVIISHIFGDL